MTAQRSIPTGRFAPSPSGPLHAGSLVAALGSWLDARAAAGRWLLRIEDLDTPRNASGAEDAILRCLAAHGLHWDGPVLRQSARLPCYEAALEQLRRQEDAYACGCSRREVEDAGGRYPGTCRAGLPAGRAARSWRMRCPPGTLVFHDRVLGECHSAVDADVGDFVLKRADGIFAYQLAVVVDDAAQGVTDVVRGLDLFTSTARQILLQQRLRLPQPRYLHLPLALLPDGRKLSKQNFAPALDTRRAGSNLIAALALLGQPLPHDTAGANPPVAAVLDWALQHWRLPPAQAIPQE